MSFFDYFRDRKKTTSPASIAKERLQIIVAHERGQRSQPDYLPQLQQEIIDVISKYVKIDRDQVHVALDNQDDCSVLELNITLPERP
ncbi:cell division topological specificity factor MinE [Halopseudomonas xinjiangensis]|uniref:Cell division topological specificity factor n=1 Tax=Halopseudomonas xinjiangensis TaxID=487184 RepID=A0A1H1U9H7_9GAMM|nr:cell division topological specificity factor MinE [Halopseudomonas xinjiangensis]SDS69090.1 cell division topological specificity factor MinE [Halopseudomonas xinjiangensis]